MHQKTKCLKKTAWENQNAWLQSSKWQCVQNCPFWVQFYKTWQIIIWFIITWKGASGLEPPQEERPWISSMTRYPRLSCHQPQLHQCPSPCFHFGPYWTAGSLIWIAEGGRKALNLVYRFSISKYGCKGGNWCQLYFSPILAWPWGTLNRERSISELQAMHLFIHFMWKEKWPDIQTYMEVAESEAVECAQVGTKNGEFCIIG